MFFFDGLTCLSMQLWIINLKLFNRQEVFKVCITTHSITPLNTFTELSIRHCPIPDTTYVISDIFTMRLFAIRSPRVKVDLSTRCGTTNRFFSESDGTWDYRTRNYTVGTFLERWFLLFLDQVQRYEVKYTKYNVGIFAVLLFWFALRRWRYFSARDIKYYNNKSSRNRLV